MIDSRIAVGLFQRWIHFSCFFFVAAGLFILPVHPQAGASKVIGGEKVTSSPGSREFGRKVSNPMLRRHRWVYDNLFAARVAPLGLVNRYRVGHRMQLVNRDTIWFRDSSVATKLEMNLSPTYGSIGPCIEIMPIAVLRLSASYHWIGYFGNLSNILSFRSQDAEHSQVVRKQEKAAGNNYATHGHQVFISGLLQGKAGPVALRGEAVLRWTGFKLRQGDRVYYDPLVDTLVPNRGWTALLDSDLLVTVKRGWIVGARYSLVGPLYTNNDLSAATEERNLNGPISRLGPALIYQFSKRLNKRFQPFLFAIIQWHLMHRYRTGLETSAALPTMIAGLQFSGDLWP